MVIHNLFASGDLNCRNFRIPTMIALPGGRVLAFCEARWHGMADWGEISIALRVSDDLGEHFSPARILFRNGHTMGNPSPVFDRVNGRLWLFMNGEDRDIRERDILAGNGVRTTLAAFSDDMGNTWSAPIDLSSSLMRSKWTWHAFGPCHGECLANGRLIIPCNHAVYNGAGGSGAYISHVSYSDDRGETWHIGGDVLPATNECTLAEVEPGLLYINMRSYAGKASRAIAYSCDGGESWERAMLDPSLPEPVCQGSVCMMRNLDKSWLLFSNPADDTRRVCLTLRASEDNGATWSRALVVKPGHAAYSDIAALDDQRILLIFETGEMDAHERIDMAIIEPGELMGDARSTAAAFHATKGGLS